MFSEAEKRSKSKACESVVGATLEGSVGSGDSGESTSDQSTTQATRRSTRSNKAVKGEHS